MSCYRQELDNSKQFEQFANALAARNVPSCKLCFKLFRKYRHCYQLYVTHNKSHCHTHCRSSSTGRTRLHSQHTVSSIKAFLVLKLQVRIENTLCFAISLFLLLLNHSLNHIRNNAALQVAFNVCHGLPAVESLANIHWPLASGYPGQSDGQYQPVRVIMVSLENLHLSVTFPAAAAVFKSITISPTEASD